MHYLSFRAAETPVFSAWVLIYDSLPSARLEAYFPSRGESVLLQPKQHAASLSIFCSVTSSMSYFPPSEQPLLGPTQRCNFFSIFLLFQKLPSRDT